jgi:hypothetical protein
MPQIVVPTLTLDQPQEYLLMNEALQNLINVLESNSKLEEAQTAARSLLQPSQDATEQEVSKVLETLGSKITTLKNSRAAFCALICGAIIENGHDCQPVVEPILNRARTMLETSASIHAKCIAAEPKLAGDVEDAEEEGFDPHELFEKTIDGFRDELPDDVDAWYSLNSIWRPVIVVLSLKPDARDAFRDAYPIAAEISDFSEAGHWISLILEVLENEPFVAIEPETKTGILGKFSGIVDNFQLNMLLMGIFPETSATKFPRISRTAAEVAIGEGPQATDETIAAPWNLCSYQAISKDGSFDASDTENWIWNEGKPSDIPVLDGHRIILLGPATYERNFAAQRMFAKLKSDIEIEETLSEQQIDEWMAKFQNAS